MQVPRSAIKSWCLGEMTNNAKVVLVKPKDLRSFTDALAEAVAAVEARLVAGGVAVIDDEGSPAKETTHV
jgi:hypothetical protein